MELALARRISGYDAFYVALTMHVNAPLITADEKLVRAMAGKYDVQSLATFPVPPLL
jgi:predicted nucleic acid-binding protein